MSSLTSSLEVEGLDVHVGAAAAREVLAGARQRSEPETRRFERREHLGHVCQHRHWLVIFIVVDC